MKISRAEIASRAQERREAGAEYSRQIPRSRICVADGGVIVVASGLCACICGQRLTTLLQEEKTTLNLNQLAGPQQLIPYLGMISAPADQEFVAKRIYDLKRHGEQFDNVGAIARLRVTESELARVTWPELVSEARRGSAEGAENSGAGQGSRSANFRYLCYTAGVRGAETSAKGAELASIAGDFSSGDLFFVGLLRRAHRVASSRICGDNVILPVIQALCWNWSDSDDQPARSRCATRCCSLIFPKASSPAVLLCCFFSLPDYERQFSRLSYVPLAAALLLAVALGIFGTGPGGSDAKVNLFFFQPMELIRILIVFFLAGYFAQNWDALRYLKQQRWQTARTLGRFSSAPRLCVYRLRRRCAFDCAFLLAERSGTRARIGCLFLTMYSIARNRFCCHVQDSR